MASRPDFVLGFVTSRSLYSFAERIFVGISSNYKYLPVDLSKMVKHDLVFYEKQQAIAVAKEEEESDNTKTVSDRSSTDRPVRFFLSLLPTLKRLSTLQRRGGKRVVFRIADPS